MKKEHSHTDTRRGFSLVELLVAISVFLVFVLATTGVMTNVAQNTRHVANIERATFLAEEALEASRNLRDASTAFASLPDGNYGLSSSTNEWSLSGTSDTSSIYSRSLNIATINGNQKKVSATVSWADQASQTNSVTASSYLTDWRTPLSIGLTIDKSVVNHGSSLTVADFLPTDLNTTGWDNTVDPPASSTISIPIVFYPSTMSLADGIYTFLTTSNPNYSLNLSTACLGGSIVLVNNDTKLCDITYEEYAIPTVTSPTKASVTGSSSTLGATVTFLGNPASISARGVCYNTTPSPTTNCTPEGGTSTGAFTQPITGLSAGLTYYYRGYATNSRGTGYSIDDTFVTTASGCTGTPWGTMSDGASNTAYQSAAVTYPASCVSETRTCSSGTLSGSYTNTSCSVTPIGVALTTTSVTGITMTTATSGGNITSDGGASVTARGVAWATTSNPTVALSTKTSDGTGTGSFSSSLTSLTCNTSYHVRAYATNSVGTAYGSDVQFTTSACPAVPTVSNTASTSITSIGATLGATVTSLGIPATLTERGICYNTAGSPTLTNGATCVAGTLAQTLTAYTVAVTGLIPGTTYKFAGYATNSTGTGYSADGTFKTLGNAGGVCSTTGVTVGTKDQSSGTTIVITKPTGILQSDLMFIYIGHESATDVLTTIPTGWTQAARTHNGSANAALYYKLAGASEPASYTFGFSASIRSGASLSIYRGCFSTTTPIDVISNTPQYTTSSTTYRAASMTLTSAYSNIILFPSVVVSGSKTFNAPTTQGGGWITDYNFGNSSSRFSRSAFSKVMSTAGATGVMDSIGTYLGTTEKNAYAVGLKPI